MESSKGRANVEGCKYNVNDALLDISQMFTRIQKEETEKQKMELLSKEVSADNDETKNVLNSTLAQKYTRVLLILSMCT